MKSITSTKPHHHQSVMPAARDQGAEPSRTILLLSPDERLAARLSRAFGAVSTVSFRHHTRLVDLPADVMIRPQEVVLLLDLSSLWAAESLDSFLQNLSFGGLEESRIVALLEPSDGYPLEWSAYLDERLLGCLSRNFHLSELEALFARSRRESADSPDYCEPISLQGKTVRFETRHRHIAAMLDDVRRVASHDVTVLLIGETGSGKTTLAKLFHELSPRQDSAFTHIACGALPPTLIESELFGHIRGAFTGAERDKIGKFEVAGNGTLLLDEIDALDLDQQVKLLKVIETREFEPVGSHDTRMGQARLVVASNVCLEGLVETQRFRQDLYYRLNVLKFQLPPLRDRRFDVIPLAMEFLQAVARKCGSRIQQVHPSFLDAIKHYHWPGNLRELNHCMERAVVLCRNGKLFASCLPAVVLAGKPDDGNYGRATGNQGSLLDKVACSEKLIIEEVLRRHNYRRTSAAEELGVSRVTLYNKMKKYGL